MVTLLNSSSDVDMADVEPSPESFVRERQAPVPAPTRPHNVVVVEVGSCFPRGFDLSSVTADCVVIAQQRDESPAALAGRVLHRLSTIRADGGVVQGMSFAVSSHQSAELRDARATMTRALLDGAAGAPCGAVDFVADQLCSEHLKLGLLAMSHELSGASTGLSPVIRVHFVPGEERRRSGIFPRLARDVPTPKIAC